MSAYDNLGRQFFTPLESNEAGPTEYSVGTRRGKSFAATHGRVAKYGTTWAALGVGSDRWTDYHPSRKAAVEQMFQMRQR